MRSKSVVASMMLFCAVLLPGWKKATMRVPESLSSVLPVDVTGHLVRTPKKPMSFGEFGVEGVRQGVEFSWSTELFGVRGGSASQRFRFVLEAPGGQVREVECRRRAIEAWRDGWSLDLTDAFTPRLACGLLGGGETLQLVLGSRLGLELRGVVTHRDGVSPRFEVRSVHQLDGSPLPLEQPAGYAVERDGVVVAAVEVLNHGRVWLSPDLGVDERVTVASLVGALLLYPPELTSQSD